MEVDPHIRIGSMDTGSLTELLQEVVCYRILEPKTGVMGVLYVALGHMTENGKRLMGREEIFPWDSFSFSIEVIRVVTAKTCKRCQDPADEAGSIVNTVQTCPVCVKEQAPEARLDVSGSQFNEFFHDQLLDLFLRLGKKAAPFLVFICGHYILWNRL